MHLLDSLRTNAWVLIVCLTAASIYWHAHQQLLIEKSHYRHQFMQLTAKKTSLLTEKNDLEIQIRNFDNPSWIEWNLMHYLGLTPEGATKILLPPLSSH